jgi:hypothetical protein
MVKFSFDSLSTREMLDYISKLEKEIRENDRDLKLCRQYVYALNRKKMEDESEEMYRIRNIYQHYQDKQNKINLLKYSRKFCRLRNKLRDLELYLIEKGIIQLNLTPEEVENTKKHVLHYIEREPNDDDINLSDEENEDN